MYYICASLHIDAELYIIQGGGELNKARKYPARFFIFV